MSFKAPMSRVEGPHPSRDNFLSRHGRWARTVGLFLLLSFLLNPALASATSTPPPRCRFAITAPASPQGYPLQDLGLSAFLNWGATGSPTLPTGVEYVRVLRVRDGDYSTTHTSLPSWLVTYPGATWLVGNEPDTSYGQDNLTAEVYAERFFTLARQIRQLDPTARIGFGSIVQPTPIRLRYLDRAWEHLTILAGGQSAASSLVDIWSIHSFILNEQPSQWGTGAPPGFENDHADAIRITDYADTHSSHLFAERIRNFRSWMAKKGERHKPLWITEYGSLFPTVEYRPDLGVTQQETVDFMLASFDFLLTARDPATGLPSDDQRLVQRWFWYSLNDSPGNFGGSLYNPEAGKARTLVGDRFAAHALTDPVAPDFMPLRVDLIPLNFSGTGTPLDFRIDIYLGNAGTNHLPADLQITVYDGLPGQGGLPLAAPLLTQDGGGCGQVSRHSLVWSNVLPYSPHTLHVSIASLSDPDLKPGNNQASFFIVTGPPRLYLPLLSN